MIVRLVIQIQRQLPHKCSRLLHPNSVPMFFYQMKDATEQLLQLAIDTHMKGRLDEADPIYRAVLTREPKHSLTNQKLGELLLTQNKIDEAVLYLK